jgi:hypothetical protein
MRSVPIAFAVPAAIGFLLVGGCSGPADPSQAGLLILDTRSVNSEKTWFEGVFKT